MNDKCELKGKLDKSEWKVVDMDSIRRLKGIETLIEEIFKILQDYVRLMGKYQMKQSDYETFLKAEHEKMIAEDVAEKMYYLNTYLNERNIILRTITGERETLESLCSTCKSESCVSNGTTISKTDYEARLKTDMITMLEDLKKEIIELPFPQKETDYMQGYSDCQLTVLDYVIQQKIDALKSKSEDKHL